MKIEKDKWKHFYVGIVMGLVLQLFLQWLIPGRIVTDTIISLLIVIAISYGFELFSKITGHGHYELMDAIAAIIGGILGIGAVLVLHGF